MFLKPAHPDVRVPDPAMQGTPMYWLPAEGREVDDAPYWHRRLVDGDVVRWTQPAAPTGADADATPSSQP